MDIEIKDLLKGKATRIKDKEYFETSKYIEPFMDRMSEYTDNFVAQVKLPDQITLTPNGDVNMEDITFNRIYIQALLPQEYNIGNDPHQEVIGMVLGIDVRKPVVKIFRGLENMACTNLCVFNPMAMECQELKPESAINFSFIKKVMDTQDNTQTILKQMVNTDFNTSLENVQNALGQWVRNTMHCYYDNGFNKVKLAASSAIDAYKLLFEDEESKYYVGLDNPTNMYNVYNAFTQINTDNRKKDIFNEYEKTLLVHDIISL